MSRPTWEAKRRPGNSFELVQNEVGGSSLGNYGNESKVRKLWGDGSVF